MESTDANVVLFTFHDATRATEIVCAVREETGVRAVALLATVPAYEVRIVGGAREGVTEARWLALALAVLDVLSWPVSVLAGSTPERERLTLPDSDGGLATFGRLIPQDGMVVLVVVCDNEAPALDTLERRFGRALFQISADRAIRMSGRAQGVRSNGGNSHRRRVPSGSLVVGPERHAGITGPLTVSRPAG
jgi:hypothetical protein